jgi:hypothetical protein
MNEARQLNGAGMARFGLPISPLMNTIRRDKNIGKLKG